MERDIRKIDKRKLKIRCIDTIFGVCYLILLVFCTHLFQSESIWEHLYLINLLVTRGRFKYLAVAFFIILSEFLIIKSIVKDNFKAHVITTVITLIISIISYYKYSILELPFIPNDVLLIGNTGEIAKFGLSMPSVIMVISVIILCLVLSLYYFFRKSYIIKEKEKAKQKGYRVILFFIRINCNL